MSCEKAHQKKIWKMIIPVLGLFPFGVEDMDFAAQFSHVSLKNHVSNVVTVGVHQALPPIFLLVKK